ncbi:hypothetical protein HZB03_01140 [Candidatus Woesearchaeota archaeon]|nr:hypothetical protein [Candidatus Woesearchaeota archaeon]
MVEILKTKNKGEVYAGYSFGNTRKVDIGDLSIPTPDFCMLVAKLTAGEYRLQVQTTEQTRIDVRYDSARKQVTIGEYEVDAKEFGFLARVVFKGGCFLWDIKDPTYRPPFVHFAIAYVMEHFPAELSEDSYLCASQQNLFQGLETRLN